MTDDTFDKSSLADVLLDAKELRKQKLALRFIEESLAIEDIHRPTFDHELEEHLRFICLPVITIEDLRKFVTVYAPMAVLRDRPELDVRVGRHTAPLGGPDVVRQLQALLIDAPTLSPYELHCRYELLHPFTDCNGRSGRALWAWRMGKRTKAISSQFLQTFYYQSLDHFRTPK